VRTIRELGEVRFHDANGRNLFLGTIGKAFAPFDNVATSAEFLNVFKNKTILMPFHKLEHF
jgi:hypothetical protein